MAQPLSSCRALQTNTCPVVLAVWDVGWERDWGPSWQWRLSYLSGLWDQQDPMRDHLWQTQPVLVTPFHPTAQGVGHVSCHIALRLYFRGMRAPAPARGNGRFTNTNICRSPLVAKKSLSSAKQLFFTPLCNTTDFKNVPSTLQCLGLSPMTWKPTLPDFRLLKIRLRQCPWAVTGKRISGLLLTQPTRFRGSALICRVLAWFPRKHGLYDHAVCQSAAPQSTRVSWPILARFGSGLTDTKYLEILWNEVDRDTAVFTKSNY